MAYTTIDKPTDYFNTVLYTGNGSTQSITGVGFQPDFVWLKGRSVVAGHNLHDVVRGVNKQVYTNTADAQETLTTLVTSFDSDGFSLGSNGNANSNTKTFVAWNWLAGGSASSNSDGSITSSVSANTTAGFSVVTYTGTGSAATVGHGLGAVPQWLMVKNTGASANWRVYHVSQGNTKAAALNITTEQAVADAGFWNNTTPTSSVFSIGSGYADSTNASSNTYVAYCFAEKKGYSKFGSYTGNGNADGPFIYTGFAVSWLMMKRTDSAAEWLIYDNKRDPFNLRDTRLEAQDNFADSTGTTKVFDFLSNGFKCKGNDSDINASGGNYIYMAFAEAPFVSSGKIPTTAI